MTRAQSAAAVAAADRDVDGDAFLARTRTHWLCNCKNRQSNNLPPTSPLIRRCCDWEQNQQKWSNLAHTVTQHTQKYNTYTDAHMLALVSCCCWLSLPAFAGNGVSSGKHMKKTCILCCHLDTFNSQTFHNDTTVTERAKCDTFFVIKKTIKKI